MNNEKLIKILEENGYDVFEWDKDEYDIFYCFRLVANVKGEFGLHNFMADRELI